MKRKNNLFAITAVFLIFVFGCTAQNNNAPNNKSTETAEDSQDGFLNPDTFSPKKCTFSPGIKCWEYLVTNKEITITIQNSLGYDISDITLSAGECGESRSPNFLHNQEKGDYVITCKTELISGNRYGDSINLTYTSENSGIQHKILGVLTANIGYKAG